MNSHIFPDNGKKLAIHPESLYETLLPSVWRTAVPLINYMASNKVVAKLSRSNNPDIYTNPLNLPTGTPTTKQEIVCTSGMIHFVYGTIFNLFGCSTSNAQIRAKDDINSVALSTASLFGSWKWLRFTPPFMQPIRYPRSFRSIHINLKERANQLAESTLLFMMAHEMGHVAFNSGLFPYSQENEELCADTFGVGIIYNHFKVTERDPAELFAGAILATRFTATLKNVGIKFSDEYPEPEERVNNISNTFLRLCQDDARFNEQSGRQYFYEIARVGFAYLDMMDDIDKHLGFKQENTDDNKDRFLVKILSQLVAITQNKNNEERENKILTDILKTKESIPPRLLDEIFQELSNIYSNPNSPATFLPKYYRTEIMAALLRADN